MISVRHVKWKWNVFFVFHIYSFIVIHSDSSYVHSLSLQNHMCRPQISPTQFAQVCPCVLRDGRENTPGSASPTVTARSVLPSTSSSVSDQFEHFPVQCNVVSPSVPALLQPVALSAGSTNPYQQVRHAWPPAQNNHSQTNSVKLIIIPNTQIHAEIFQERICWPLQMSAYNNSLETHTHTQKNMHAGDSCAVVICRACTFICMQTNAYTCIFYKACLNFNNLMRGNSVDFNMRWYGL